MAVPRAAGSGKSHALLLECLRHINNPKFSAVIFRNSYPQITMPGGLLERSIQIYPYAGGKLKQGPPPSWIFPSGARIELRYIANDRDVMNYIGSEIALIAFDEVTMVSEYAFLFMLSRNRSTSGLKPYIRMSCNPDAESWLAKWVEWWINDAGFPIPERSGVIRWFVRQQSELHWADTREELRDHFPDILPKSFTFVSAKITDNPALLNLDPGYLSNLQALHPVDKARLLDGNWKIKVDAGTFISREWLDITDDYPLQGGICRYWDLASTEKQNKSDDPDYTAGVKILRAPDGTYYVLDVIAVRISAANVNQLIVNTAHQDGAGCKVRWEIEPGSAGKINTSTLSKLLSGYDAAGVRSQGEKMTRAKGFATSASDGKVKLIRAAWNDTYLAELHSFPDGKHDDRLDASSGAYNELNKATRKQPPAASYIRW